LKLKVSILDEVMFLCNTA